MITQEELLRWMKWKMACFEAVEWVLESQFETVQGLYANCPIPYWTDWVIESLEVMTEYTIEADKVWNNYKASRKADPFGAWPALRVEMEILRQRYADERKPDWSVVEPVLRASIDEMNKIFGREKQA
jgi:hypothetical protein